MKQVIGITGWKNAGKTTLTAALVSHFTQRGLTVSTIKHAHHTADIDSNGTDSFKHRQAGAREVMLATPRRFALMHELGAAEEEPGLSALLSRMADADLILVEGFKREDIPKIMILRDGEDAEQSAHGIPNIIALVGARPIDTRPGIPVFAQDDIPAIADFIAAFSGLSDPGGQP